MSASGRWWWRGRGHGDGDRSSDRRTRGRRGRHVGDPRRNEGRRGGQRGERLQQPDERVAGGAQGTPRGGSGVARRAGGRARGSGPVEDAGQPARGYAVTRAGGSLYRARHLLWAMAVVLFVGGAVAVVFLLVDRDRMATQLEQEANLRGEAVSTLAGDVRALREVGRAHV